MEKKRLTAEDWGLIAPGRIFSLGNTKVKIKSLSLEEIFDVLLLANDALVIAMSKGVSLDNWHQKESLVEIKLLLSGHLPQIVEIASDLDGDEFRKLPGNLQVDFIAEAIAENIAIVESATKNSDALIAGLNATKTMQNQVSQPENS